MSRQDADEALNNALAEIEVLPPRIGPAEVSVSQLRGSYCTCHALPTPGTVRSSFASSPFSTGWDSAWLGPSGSKEAAAAPVGKALVAARGAVECVVGDGLDRMSGRSFEAVTRLRLDPWSTWSRSARE
jgi:hypothetical protein